MYPARIFAVLLTICLIICSLSLPVSATATVLPYTQSSDSLTTNGLYLRLNLRNEWGNSNCTDLQPSSASDYLSVTFTISGLGKLSEPYVVSLLGAGRPYIFRNRGRYSNPRRGAYYTGRNISGENPASARSCGGFLFDAGNKHSTCCLYRYYGCS